MQSEWHLQTEKLPSFTWLALALELQFARKILCSQLHCDFERRKSEEFLEGSVETSILMICVCF